MKHSVSKRIEPLLSHVVARWDQESASRGKATVLSHGYQAELVGSSSERKLDRRFVARLGEGRAPESYLSLGCPARWHWASYARPRAAAQTSAKMRCCREFAGQRHVPSGFLGILEVIRAIRLAAANGVRMFGRFPRSVKKCA